MRNGGHEKTQKEVADELRNITKLYIKARKKDNKKDEKRNNEQDGLIPHLGTVRISPFGDGVFLGIPHLGTEIF